MRQDWDVLRSLVHGSGAHQGAEGRGEMSNGPVQILVSVSPGQQNGRKQMMKLRYITKYSEEECECTSIEVDGECASAATTESHILFDSSFRHNSDLAEPNISYYFYEEDLIAEPCSKAEVRDFTKVFLPVAYSLICVIGLVGNIFVVMTFTLYERTKSMTDVYLLNMAIADILFVLTLPLWAVNYAVDTWIFSDFVCKMSRGIYAINFNCGMLLLTFISVDRYIAIVQATKSFKLRTRMLAYSKLICLVVWIASGLISTSSFLYSKSFTFSVNETKEICDHRYDKPPNSLTLKLLLLILQFGFGFFIPFVVMIFCYTFIIRSLQQTQNSKRNKAIRVIVLIVVVFLVCQVPHNVVLLMTATNLGKMDKSCDSEKKMAYAKYTTEAIAFLHCCLNPVLYAFIGVKFRSYFVKIMKDLRCMRYKKYSSRNSRTNSDTYHSRQTSEILSENASSFTI
ncbi:PREDICTED: C-C chemokine receptor type 6 [Tinamus guttatus]|uniref:C-C chemokine receptor type 6 n=1 Tax=Tinamus guttatus TaxID=94827 RepID=UPI00052EE3C8|nr:PREDICTED: C-C chemokine receptor type 6 [Tinamus guttatus]